METFTPFTLLETNSYNSYNRNAFVQCFKNFKMKTYISLKIIAEMHSDESSETEPEHLALKFLDTMSNGECQDPRY